MKWDKNLDQVGTLSMPCLDRKVDNLNRNYLLLKTMHLENEIHIPFISMYNENSDVLSNIIQKHWSIFSNTLRNIIEIWISFIISYKWNQIVKERLIRTDVGPSKMEQLMFLSPDKKGVFPTSSDEQSTVYHMISMWSMYYNASVNSYMWGRQLHI